MVLKDKKSKIKDLGLVSSEGSFPGLQTATFLLLSPCGKEWCVRGEWDISLPLLIWPKSYQIRTVPVWPHLTLIASQGFSLIQSHWGLGVPHMNGWVPQFGPYHVLMHTHNALGQELMLWWEYLSLNIYSEDNTLESGLVVCSERCADSLLEGREVGATSSFC